MNLSNLRNKNASNVAKNITNGDTFYICKTPDPKPMQGVMISSKSDIPDTLKNSVIFVENENDIPDNIESNLRFNNGNAERKDMKTGKWNQVSTPQILTQAVENKGMYMSCDNNMLIKYENTDQLDSGIGTWPKTNWATTTYQDDNGGWHNKPAVLQAALIGDKLPEFADGGAIEQTENGCEVHTSWGSVSDGKSGEAYLIRYGDDNQDGSPNLNILTHTEESVDTYSVCNADGKPICGLREADDAVQAQLALQANYNGREIPTVDNSFDNIDKINELN